MRRAPALACAVALVAAAATATETQTFVLDTPHALAGSLSSGVAIFPDGSLQALPPVEQVAEFEEPLGLALAVTDDGVAYVGTGHPARVWRVENGKKHLVADLGGGQVTALLLAPSGDLYVATAVPARLLRLPRGGTKLEQVSTLSQGNIWDLAWYRGALLAAAGNPGRLLRLGAKGLEVAATVPDQHARCLAVVGDTLLIGTSGKGLVARWDGSGPVGVLYDSAFTEIAALVAAPDGTAYAAGLTGDPTLGASPKADTAESAVTVSTDSTAAPKTASGASATSEVLHVFPQGAVVPAYRFETQLAGALAWGDNGLVIGTGLEGELWQLVDGAAARLDTVDAAQVVRLAQGGRWILTQGPVTLRRRSGPPRGSFTSPAEDAGQPAEWGEATVRTASEASPACTVRFRSGATSPPDATWSDWTTALPCSRARIAAPPARYLQWRIALDGGERVDGVRVAYRQINLPPEIDQLTVHAPAEVFLKNPPPSDRIVEMTHPEASGIFTTLDEEENENQARLGKKYYRVGYQSVSWKASDPNGDSLRFDLEISRRGSDRWWTVRRDLETVVIAIDTQALADGIYRFRLTASDAPDNPVSPATATQLSPWVIVDNTPPHLAVTRNGDHWDVEATDDLSPIIRVEWNRDADTWHPLSPLNGLLDSTQERFTIPAEAGHHVLAVRAVDDHYNRVTVAVEEGP
jgi:hypothetical protein